MIAVEGVVQRVAACAAEHGETGPVLGVAFDGGALGSDGAIWGGEFLLVNGAAFERRGHLAYVPLPGGDVAARLPWRSAAAHVASAYPGKAKRAASDYQPDSVGHVEWALVQQLLLRADTPRTSSVGRLFDAIASLLGICHVSRVEGEAAMSLETLADVSTERSYTTTLTAGAPWTADAGDIVRAVLDDGRRGRSVAEIAGAFHRALADLVAAGCDRVRDETGVATVALTGSVFSNALLLSLARNALAARGFRVLIAH